MSTRSTRLIELVSKAGSKILHPIREILKRTFVGQGRGGYNVTKLLCYLVIAIGWARVLFVGRDLRWRLPFASNQLPWFRSIPSSPLGLAVAALTAAETPPARPSVSQLQMDIILMPSFVPFFHGTHTDTAKKHGVTSEIVARENWRDVIAGMLTEWVENKDENLTE
ncbi:hypothetical protein PILCRDRAFT_91587 [Piloderma croceum F 1598]|uniref:Uncharacterized protein n=1 Tax=Piloderma croceum (strain F 1598) TaxID=765440 RepID=A0A0C3ARE6_PILCF|nr:hypothetical protein PILCRDRAFT_91587 [Piloderma croceum F 1598]